MGMKKSFVLRIEQESYDKIERWAADEFRSVNGQIEWLIRRALKEAGRLKDIDNQSETLNSNDDDTNKNSVE